MLSKQAKIIDNFKWNCRNVEEYNLDLQEQPTGWEIEALQLTNQQIELTEKTKKIKWKKQKEYNYYN